VWLVVALEPAALDALQEHQLGAEAFGLPTGQPRQLGTADPVREAEEVLDHGRVRGLSPGHIAVEHDRREAVGGRVDGGGEAGGAGADDDEVVVRPFRRPEAAPSRLGIGDWTPAGHSLAACTPTVESVRNSAAT